MSDLTESTEVWNKACAAAAQDVIGSLQEKCMLERIEKNEAYRQRNHLVAALARLYPSGIRKTDIDGWDAEWHGCVYIDLPSGQISYHYHDSQADLFANLPPYTKDWDGHDKDTVHQRLAQIEGRRGEASVMPKIRINSMRRPLKFDQPKDKEDLDELISTILWEFRSVTRGPFSSETLPRYFRRRLAEHGVQMINVLPVGETAGDHYRFAAIRDNPYFTAMK